MSGCGDDQRSMRVRSASRLRGSRGGYRRNVVEPLEGRILFSSIAQENQLPGTPPSQWFLTNDGDTSIQGYATDMSADQGGAIDFKINDPSLTPYRLDIYRMGYYQGLGARKVATIPSSETIRVNQPAPLFEPTTGLTDAGNWGVTASWSVPADATSGIYFANAVREDTGGFSQIIFVVRDDDGHSDMLFQTSDTTWQAYNAWGGKSLYISAGGGLRAQKVSYNRPFTTRSSTLLGRDFVFGPEFAMTRFLEANGYDVSYSSGLDTARRGEEIKEHKVFLSVGHDEYWSGEMRASVESAREAGVHLAFFSGNEVYWKTRWENSISADGAPMRTMVVYKETNANAKSDPSPLWTGTWRDPRFSPPSDGGYPENALTGQLFTVNRGPGGDRGTSFNVPADFSNLRFWRNTSVASLAPGQVATLGDIVLGYEWDEDIDNGFRPAGLVRMSSTTQTVPQRLQDFGSTVAQDVATHALTLYRASSGALVFGAGTVQWSYGLDGTHDGPQTVPSTPMRQATVNLFADMGVQPATLASGLLSASMSTDITPPVSSITSPTSGSFSVGAPFTITGTASDVGGVVGAVEISADGGTTWHPVTGRDQWTYTWTPSAVGAVTLMTRAADDSGNLEAAHAGASITLRPEPTSTSGLVGAWNFDAGSGNSLADVSGNGNNGNINGASWVPGMFGNSLRFNGIGSGDWVTVPDSNSLDLTTAMTLEAWVKPAIIAGTWSAIALKEQTAGLTYAMYATDGSNAPPAGNASFGSSIHTARGLTPLTVNTWSHLAVTYGNGALRMYVNGALVAERSDTGPMDTSSGPLRFGGNSIWGEYFNGCIDEIRLYNRTLNQGEIRSDMGTPIGGAPDAVAPSISVSSPAPGANVSGRFTLTADASDNVAVEGVQFFVNGTPVGVEDRVAPYTLDWDSRTVPNGPYTITARALDYLGNSKLSSPVSVTVNNGADPVAPSVQIRYPGAATAVSGLVPLWATAADNVAIAGVRFKLNGVNIGAEDTVAPYRVVFDSSTTAEGTYTLTATARDVAGNVTVSAPVTLRIDHTAPTVVTQLPGPGAINVPTDGAGFSATFGEDMDPNVVVQMRDPLGQSVAGTMQYDAATRTATFTPAALLFGTTTYTITVAQARDVAGNALASPVNWTVTTAAQALVASLWPDTTVPQTPSAPDAASIEVGMKFRSTVAGFITGIRFYKGAGNGGTHVGRLYRADGTLLSSITFASETDTGWQRASFPTPVPVDANAVYVIAYYAPQGHYALNKTYFTRDITNSQLTAPASGGADGSNGVYRYGTGGVMPTQSSSSSNYWVDVVFTENPLPNVTANSPASGEAGVLINSDLTATFERAVVPSTVSFILRNAAGDAIAAVLTMDASARTATLNPGQNLVYGGTYTATVSGATDTVGNVMNPFSWTFSTATGPDVTAPTVVVVTPTNATTVAPASTVSVRFNEKIQPSTVSLRVLDQAGREVPAVLSYDGANTITFRPTPPGGLPGGCCGNCSHCPLNPATTYQVTLSGAQDLAGNLMLGSYSWSFTTDPLIANASLWGGSATPAVDTALDAAAVELGVKFRANTLGFVTGLRFYKGAGNTGTHVGHLWDENGMLLASAVFDNETAGGWQDVTFDGAILVAPNKTYVASYFAPRGGYSMTASYFASAGFVNGPLSAPSNNSSGGNGVFSYGPEGVFPSSSRLSTNYWVDVAFTNALIPDTTPPAVLVQSPAPQAVAVPTGSIITVRFSERMDPASITAATFHLRAAGSNTDVPATVSYSGSTATLTPSVPLDGTTTYTVTVARTVTDRSGNALGADATWSFATAEADVTPPVISSVGTSGVTTVGATVTWTTDEPASTQVEYGLTTGYGFSTLLNTSLVTAHNATLTGLQPATVYHYRVWSRDVSGNAIASGDFTLTTNVANIAASLWPDGTVPAVAAAADPAPIEVGMKFRSAFAGFITGVRFYKGAGNGGTHVGRLYRTDGTLLSSVTFKNETESGWQRASFPTPIAITANTTYVISYYTPQGHYAVNKSYFIHAATAGQLTGLASGGADGSNGVYRYGTGGVLPTQSASSSNYWVDVVFSDDGTDRAAPEVAEHVPPTGGAVGSATPVTVTFTEPMDPATLTTSTLFLRADATGIDVPITIGYSGSTAMLTPSVPLDGTTTYSVIVLGLVTDRAGNAIGADVTWSFQVDTTFPVISGVSASGIISTTATIAWTTDERASSQVEYGFTTGYGSSTLLNASLVTAHAVTLTGLQPATLYHYRVWSRDAAGNPVASEDFTLTTSVNDLASSFWSNTALPGTTASTDAAAVEVGMKFRSTVAGFITGVRFYKGAGNGGTHVGRLYRADGTLLSSVTFTGETDSGWQLASFPTPVAITANTTYVIAYHAPQGRYAVNKSYFTRDIANSQLTAPASGGADGNNGVYRYGAGGVMPTQSYFNSNYWVDVVFIDTPIPLPAPPDLAVASDSGLSGIDNVTNATSLVFTGTIDPGNTVTILADGVALGQAVADSSGNYQFAASLLGEGTYLITAQAQNPAGTLSHVSLPLTVTIDRSTSSPSVPDLEAASDSGSSNADNLTNALAPVVTGTTEPGSVVTLSSDGTALGQAVADASGKFTFTMLSLADGTHLITAQSQDVAGNVSAVTQALAITIDRSAATPGLPDLDVGSDSGSSNTDNLTNAAAPVFTGTAESGITVLFFADGVLLGQTIADASGNYGFTATSLADGTRQIATQFRDAAGNGSPVSPALAVRIDRSIATPSVPDLEAASDNGPSNSDNVTNASAPVFAGTVEAGATVTVFADGALLGTALADGAGLFRFTSPALADGVHQITVQVRDLAGNVSPVSAALPVTLDRSMTTPSAPDLDSASDSGDSNTDNLTASLAPVFTGTAKPGSAVTIFSDGVSVGQAIADGAGNYLFTAPPLGQGVHQITAQAQDTAGNVSSATAPLAVTVDSVTPLAPSTPDLQAASDSGPSNSDNVTSATAPVFAGTAEPGSTVTVFADGTSIGQAVADGSGNYQFTAGSLAEGTHQLTTRAQDAAGNFSASAALAVTIDRTAPTADVIDVTPDPRSTPVDSTQLVFSEPMAGLTLASVRLTRDGVVQSLAGVTLSGPAADGRTYTIGNLTAVTSIAGTYQLSFLAAGSGLADAAGNAWASDASDSWVMQTTVNAAPTNNSLTPASATDAVGVYRTFTAAYRDANGAADLSLVYLRVNDFIPIMLDCVYDAVANKLFVRSADGLTLTGGFAPGSANVISTTHGSLDCALTTVSSSGTQLTVNWRIACAAPLNGPNALYLRARDKGTPSLDSGYQRMSLGVWNVTGNTAPAVAAPTPLAPSTAPGVAQSFSVTYSDPDGWENLSNVYLRINADLPWMLDAVYNVPSGRLYLRNDAGQLAGGFQAGSNNVISNGHGSLNCAAVTVTHSASGTDLTVNWNLTAGTSAGSYLAGNNRVFVRSRDAAGADSGYREFAGASWTITGNVAPVNRGVTPAAPSDAAGTQRTLVASYEDANGGGNFQFVYLSINAGNPAKKLQVTYDRQFNRLYLLADDGVTQLGGFAPGSNNVISNSRGSLNCAATTVSFAATRLTIGWAVSATSVLAGNNTVSLRVRDRGGLDTGFVLQSGVTWNIT